ncbi:hypothetical protein SCLCIDRAFT_1222093 [Scleroderma citrinum Foug A]|uniref:Uncharacterized protein n=1 Tax=Scleroderma citrinum Foug A TaxID=1036808 RepID=A0A0C3D0N2_9AGAM|nr:hypothetical protein SCLCIDRAFT_1222093 [Scleroderma citrinum Foug A]
MPCLRDQVDVVWDYVQSVGSSNPPVFCLHSFEGGNARCRKWSFDVKWRYPRRIASHTDDAISTLDWSRHYQYSLI